VTETCLQICNEINFLKSVEKIKTGSDIKYYMVHVDLYPGGREVP